MTTALPTARVAWSPCYRITSMHVRPEAIFEQVADPADVADVLAVRVAGEAVPLDPDAGAVGPGAGWVMLPFLRFSRQGSRFADGTYGVYYAARDEATAVAETRFHAARFLAATREPPQLLGMRVLEAELDATLVDLRGRGADHPELSDPDPERYGPAQAWARALRTAGASGVVYDGVRRAGGECAAVFRPRLVRRCRPARTLAYEWDGAGIVAVYAVRPFP